MSISSISSQNQLYSIYGIQDIDQSQSSQTTTSSSTTSESDKTSFSKMGQMMSQLFSLQSSDPDKFKEVAQEIADDLAKQASSATSTGQATMYSDLSAKFSEAAQTGSMDSLKPQGPPPPPPGGASAGSGQGGDMQAGFDELNSIISQSLGSTSSTSSDSTSQTSSGTSGKDLFAQLASLQSSDPAKFKEVAASISQQLADQAKSVSDPGESAFLSDMSSKFAEASTSGSMDSIKPKGRHGHHGSSQGGTTQSGTADSSTTTSASTDTTSTSTAGSTDSTQLDAIKMFFQNLESTMSARLGLLGSTTGTTTAAAA
ncbi:hypothetical protein [Fundidesulfovibrio agrisoli]|uniref:hypothetical protein n=1 Tax=Fundidesulfovibrio agrisoli TaxID=2922717 RepID=UPI001FAE0125|nr:hypothetical protein [Fundidesulfovibrio agrisoli]